VEADEIPVAPSPDRPVAPRRPVVHEAHGVSRVDDYAWLREADDPEVAGYLEAEQAHFERAMKPLGSAVDVLHAEMTGRMPAADASVTWRRAGVVYFTRSRRTEPYERLYRLDPQTGEERLLLDPNLLVRGGSVTGIRLVEPSPDGQLVAYLVDPAGGGAAEVRVRDTGTGLDLPDRITGVAGTVAWSADSARLLYTVADRIGRADTVRLHVLGAPPDQDAEVLAEPDPQFELTVHTSRDGRWLVVGAASPDSTEVHLVPSDEPTAPPRLVAERRPQIRYLVDPMAGGWNGAGADLLLLISNEGAAGFRLFQAPLPPPNGRGDSADWVPVAGLPGGVDRLDSVHVLSRHVLLIARQGGEPFLRVIDRPAPGTELPPRPTTREVHPGLPHGQLRLWHPEDPETTTVVIVEENLVTAPAWTAVDLTTGARTVIKRRSTPGVDPTKYVTERLFATAPDGVRVPITIAHLRDARRGKTAGLLLLGYGAFEACSWPRFALGTLSLLDRDMVVAIAHVRGGGELGPAWWHAGRARHKQRSFVDYVAVRDALVAAGWAGQVTGGARVVTRGREAGGLLQAAVFSRAPRMWRAVVAEQPLVDVVTSMSDPDLPLGAQDRLEWGDPVTSAGELAEMLSWSPYDNPPPPGRPALLVSTARGDRRVPIHEPAKWVARLRATDDPRSPSPLLMRVESGNGPAGRGPAGRGPADRRDEAAVLAGILHQLELA
jgi:oligopeptidase B